VACFGPHLQDGCEILDENRRASKSGAKSNKAPKLPTAVEAFSFRDFADSTIFVFAFPRLSFMSTFFIFSDSDLDAIKTQGVSYQ
jgi:hypothetical protein